MPRPGRNSAYLTQGFVAIVTRWKFQCVILMARATLLTALSLFPRRASKLQSLFSLAKIDHLFKNAASPVRNKTWRRYFADCLPYGGGGSAIFCGLCVFRNNVVLRNYLCYIPRRAPVSLLYISQWLVRTWVKQQKLLFLNPLIVWLSLSAVGM